MKQFKEYIAEISKFKRDEIAFELRHEEEEMRRDREAQYIFINGKPWKKNGEPIRFNNKAHAMKAVQTMLKKKPQNKFHIVHHAKYPDAVSGSYKLMADGKQINK